MAAIRLGMLGGSFNPVHMGHVRAALFARDALELDLMLLMPVAQPPHKEMAGGANAGERLAMLRLAFEGQPRVEVSELELLRDGRSYTVDTAIQLHELYQTETLYLVMGSDMLLTLEQWREYRTLLSLCKPAVFLRHKDEEAAVREQMERLRSLCGAESLLLSMPPVEVSSTQLREALKTGGNPHGLLPPGVQEYIARNGLYKGKME